MNQKNYRGHMQKETGEGREQRLAAQREYHREYTKNVPAEEKEWKRKMIMNARNREYYRKKLMRETEEERTRKKEKRKANYQTKKK